MEMMPVLVVEIIPVFVVEMMPVLANTWVAMAITRIPAQTIG